MNALDELLRALAEYQPPPPVEHIYRIYYDADTGEILKHTYNEESDIGPCLVFDLEGYERAKAIFNDAVVIDGRLVKRPDPNTYLPLQLSDRGVAAMKDNMVFLDDGSLKEVEFWDKNG